MVITGILVAGSFFFNDTATTEIYTLSLHDALPISRPAAPARRPATRQALLHPAWVSRRGDDRFAAFQHLAHDLQPESARRTGDKPNPATASPCRPSRVMSGPPFVDGSTALYSARSAPASVARRRIEELRYEHARRCRPIGKVPRHRHAALGFAPADRRTAP